VLENSTSGRRTAEVTRSRQKGRPFRSALAGDSRAPICVLWAGELLGYRPYFGLSPSVNFPETIESWVSPSGRDNRTRVPVRRGPSVRVSSVRATVSRGLFLGPRCGWLPIYPPLYSTSNSRSSSFISLGQTVPRR
jgi:hypothetical protein